MKINIVLSIIAVALSSLITYGLYTIYDGENQMLLSIGSLMFLSFTLAFTIGVNFEQSRITTNIRAISGIFFVLALISNLIFTFIDFSIPSYVITNGLLFLVFILIVYSISSAKQ
jgi:hypothetical protein